MQVHSWRMEKERFIREGFEDDVWGRNWEVLRENWVPLIHSFGNSRWKFSQHRGIV